LIVLCALRCYEYQSSESPGWQQSEAIRFCEALKATAIREATMDVDVWEIADRNVFLRSQLGLDHGIGQ
jgi:hypothetical protein